MNRLKYYNESEDANEWNSPGLTVGPAGVIGENVKIKPATVLQVIRIILTGQIRYSHTRNLFEERHKIPSAAPRVVGAAGGQKSEKEVCN